MTHTDEVMRPMHDDKVNTLNSRMGTGGNPCLNGVALPHTGRVRFTLSDNEPVANTLTATYYKGVGNREGKERPVVINEQTPEYIVRRLTPLECERLQGYPDGWTDIGEWTDSKGKKHKEADSPRYKALGNSIALPQWQWIIDRMAAYLPEDATLGSLFDGIGGFPLCWERTHGKGTARWASEIEEFPMAVTKKHFPEEGAYHEGGVI